MANKISVDVELSTKDAVNSIRKLDKTIGNFSKDVQRDLKKTTGAFDVFKGALGAGAVLNAVKTLGRTFSSAIGSIVKSSIDLEQIETRFKILTGSTEAATKAIAELQNFTATTPFQFDGVSNAAAQLISFGFNVDEVVPKLRAIGDVAAGSGSSLGEISLIFGQVSAAGKLTGERLLQFQERAVPIGAAIAQTLGVAETAVKDLVSNGKVDFATFEKAFQSLSAEGGVFFEATIKQSKTLGGVISTLKDNFALAATDIGQAFLPALKEAAIVIIKVVQNNRELIKQFASRAAEAFASSIKSASTALSELSAFVTRNIEAIKAISFAIGVYISQIVIAKAATIAYAVGTKGLTVATIAMNAALSITPWGIIRIAIVALIPIIAAVVQNFQSVKAIFLEMTATLLESLVPAIRLVLKASNSLASVFGKTELGSKIEESIESIEKLSASLRQQSVDAIKTADDIAIAKEKEAMVTVSANNQIIKSEQDKKKAIAGSGGGNKSRLDILEEEAARRKLTEEEINEFVGLKRQEDLDNFKDFNQQKVEEERKFQDDIAVLKEEIAQKEREKLLIDDEDLIERNEARFEQLQETLGTEEAIRQLAREESIKNDDARRKAELDGDKKAVSQKKKIIIGFGMWEELKAKEKLKLVNTTNNALLGLSQEAAGEQHGVTKALATTQAAILAAQAILQAMSSLPFPANIAAAATVAIAAGKQISAINSSKPPSYQDGGIVGTGFSPGGRDNTLVQAASGEMILNRRQQENLFNSIAQGDIGGNNVTLNIEGNVVADDESQINELIDRINDQIEFRNADLRAG